MADPSLNNNSKYPLKDEKGEDSILLRSRPFYKDVPKIEELDKKYKDLILALPKEEAWLPFPMRNYKGFWQHEQLLYGTMAMEEAFHPRPSDVIVASYPKSGTTWLKALTFTIMYRNKYTFSSHPLLKLNPHACVPFMQYFYAARDEQYLETLPSPRVLGTHLSYSILPESIKTSKCHIVYICRDPKDVIVSHWHMVTRFEWSFKEPFPFTRAFELFCEGRTPYGPVWDHVLEYYMKSLHSPEKVLFLKYEEMMKDPIDGVIRLAKFIGCPFSEEEMKNGLVKEMVEFCSFNKLKDLDINKNEGIGNDCFFRKAVVGDWQNHMTSDMAFKLDEIIKEKLHNAGFTY
ncbi:flavonol 4'-sulfotransferase-like protein [Carex littledalei]|uniref:Sulfotransferase n=1 Tax=Carex littledalei TaxID=544730 RepID=A0A833RCE1_9POAL|nr:flavonol 4'-sulfotransferase-like protein [Carex littledalei]